MEGKWADMAKRRVDSLDHPTNPEYRWCRYCGAYRPQAAFRIINTRRQGAMKATVCNDCNMKVQATPTIRNAKKVYRRVLTRHVPSPASIAAEMALTRAFINHTHVVNRRHTMEMWKHNDTPGVRETPYRMVQQNSLPTIPTADGLNAEWYVINTETGVWDGPCRSHQAAVALLHSKASAWHMMQRRSAATKEND